MRTINLNITLNVVLKADDDADLDAIMDEMDYTLLDHTQTCDIEDVTVESYNVTDSH